MESNISRTAYALIGYGARILLIILAALFAMTACTVFICAFIDSDAFMLSMAASAAFGFMAALLWDIRKDIPVKLED